MKLLSNRLFLSLEDALACALTTENYITKARSTNNKSWTFIDDPDDKRKMLIEYDSLKPKYKELVEKRFGNPYEYVAKQPIKDMVREDDKARDFFLSYKYDDKKHLPIEKVKAYAIAANWLNMLVNAETNKKDLKKQLSLSRSEFWANVGEIITADKIDLPSNYIRLSQKVKDYQTNGYASLVHKQFGNGNAKKVDCEVSESVLIQICSSPRFKDDFIRARYYNQWAVANGKDQITPDTVGKWRRKNNYQTMIDREGSKEWYNVFGKQIQRLRPSAPLLLVGSDDNDIDLYFIDYTTRKGQNFTNYFHRKVLIVVMDAFNDYILGYAVADTITADVVRLAYLDAVHHIHQLTGGWYLPHQLQTDRWGMGTLDNFYKGIATYTPAAARAPRGKYIEQAFGKKWHQELCLYENYAGQNITAKTRLNTEHLQVVKKNFPVKDQAHLQIEQFITTMRNLTDSETGKTRQQHWIDAFTMSDLSQKRKIDEVQMLLLFGTTHTHINTITNRGIAPSINRMERVYDIPEEYYLECVGKKMQVIYDPLDYSRILVTDNATTRFIAHESEKMPSAIADFKPGDRTRLNAKLDEKRRHVELIAKSKEQRQNVLQHFNIDVSSMIQAGTHHLPKEQKQLVEKAYHERGNGVKGDFDPLDRM